MSMHGTYLEVTTFWWHNFKKQPLPFSWCSSFFLIYNWFKRFALLTCRREASWPQARQQSWPWRPWRGPRRSWEKRSGPRERPFRAWREGSRRRAVVVGQWKCSDGWRLRCFRRERLDGIWKSCNNDMVEWNDVLLNCLGFRFGLYKRMLKEDITKHGFGSLALVVFRIYGKSAKLSY